MKCRCIALMVSWWSSVIDAGEKPKSHQGSQCPVSAFILIFVSVSLFLLLCGALLVSCPCDRNLLWSRCCSRDAFRGRLESSVMLLLLLLLRVLIHVWREENTSCWPDDPTTSGWVIALILFYTPTVIIDFCWFLFFQINWQILRSVVFLIFFQTNNPDPSIHLFYIQIYIYIRAVSVNALIYAINLAALTH